MLRTLLILFCALSFFGCGETGGGTPSAKELLFSDVKLNIAHRGGRAERPEHTMVAYQHAIDVGTHVLELDVSSTMDGVLVVMHDLTVDRTTDGSGAILDMTFDEILELDAGYDFSEDGGETFPYRGMGLQVPSLEEVLEAFPDVPYVIEIKQDAPSIVDEFVQVCRDTGAVEQMVGAAFSDEVLAELRIAAPEMATNMGVLEVLEFAGLSLEDEATWEPPGEFLQVPPVFQGIPVLDAEFVARAERLSLKVHAWTINDAEEMQELLDLGVDGIITDYPTRLNEVLQ